MITNDPKINIKTEGPANKTSRYDPSKHLGRLGEFFGGAENAPTSISGFIVILLIVIGAFNSWFRPDITMEYWKSIVLPTVTGLFGYLFGKHQK
jgi:hypothetical protein